MLDEEAKKILNLKFPNRPQVAHREVQEDKSELGIRFAEVFDKKSDKPVTEEVTG